MSAGHQITPLACHQISPAGIVVHDGVVYWTSYAAATSGGAIMSLPTNGGTPTLLVPDQDYPWAIAVDDHNVYWTNYDNSGAADFEGFSGSPHGEVLQVPLAAGSVTTLASGLSAPWGIAVDPTKVYFTGQSADGGVVNTGVVKSVPIGGTAVTILAQGLGQPLGIATIQGMGPEARVTAVVELDVNLTVEGAKGPASAYLVERWTLWIDDDLYWVAEADASGMTQGVAQHFDVVSSQDLARAVEVVLA